MDISPNSNNGFTPKKLRVRIFDSIAILLGLLMVVASLFAYILKPSKYLSELFPVGKIQEIMPNKFGEWVLDAVPANIIVNPVVEENLFGIYAQTVSRTYVNASGYRVMLSIAYGGDQSRELQVHRPEVCYAAGGFSISMMKKVGLRTEIREIPAMQLVATNGHRKEPVTYWVRIGERIVRGNMEQGVARAKYGLSGYIPDGLLFRVSSIDNDIVSAFSIQQEFVSSFVNAIPATKQSIFFGSIR